MEMESKQEQGIECNLNSKTSLIPWRSETNWIIAHGFLEASVAVESSDYPIDESNLETVARKLPLVLQPRLPDCPCEIKICFEQKYDIGQIYVRSTARMYEVYYARSPSSSNEYLCTVRCGVAERDGELLQTTWTEDVAEEHGECVLGDLTEETITDGTNVVSSDDDWVKIKVPEVQRSNVSENIFSNGIKNVQDLYEATAQISDTDPCSCLTIRLLSLQEKTHVYVDEVYVFADPADPTDSGNESLLAGNSTQSSIMAMFVPTLLQLSKSGRVQEKHASDEVLKADAMGTELRRIDENDDRLETDEVPQQNVKPVGVDKADSAELLQHTSAEKCVEPVTINDLPQGRFETALEQLISRVSRVEEFFLRFEEKMLKPIERIDARLQKVEDQLEKLAKKPQYLCSSHGTRISAPAFSCSESNSSSFCNEQSNYAPCVASELGKKDISSNNTPELPCHANFHPGLIVTAPEFSCDEEEEEDYDNLKPIEDSHRIEPKKTLSVDDALAAALNRFLSSALNHPSELKETTSTLLSEVHEQNQYQKHSDIVKAQELLAAENGCRDSPRYAQVLTVNAPDFIAEENGDVEDLNYTQSTSDKVCVDKDKGNENRDEMVPPSNQSKSLFASAHSASASDGDLPSASVEKSSKYLDGHLNESFEVNTVDVYFGGDTNCNPVETSNDSTPDLAEDSVETSGHQIYEETYPEKTTSSHPDYEEFSLEQVVRDWIASEVQEKYVAVEDSFGDDNLNVYDSFCGFPLDFEFPILQVEFNSDMYTSTKSPLEALLDGAAESKTEGTSVHDSGDDDDRQIKDVFMDSDETKDVLPINHLLVDVGVSASDGSSDTEGGSHYMCTPSCPEMSVSLI